jgi:DNA modification methylase
MYCKSENFTLYHGDNRQVLPTFAENSVDAIVTDPPYELGFMGKSWDASGVAFDPATWREALRVLKPGGHLIAFSGSRTYHRMAVAIEDAGFEIRDQIMWIYGSGFPKSHNISKGIDKTQELSRKLAIGFQSSGEYGERKFA